MRFPALDPEARPEAERTDRTTPAPEPILEPVPELVPEPVSPAPISPDETLEEIAARRPGDVARVIRTILIRSAAQPPEGESSEPLGRRDVAVLIVGLGSSLSAGILRFCSDLEAETIAQAITELDHVSVEEKGVVSGAVHQRLVSGDYLIQGGVDFAREVLQKALGPRKAQELMNRVTSTTSSGFYLLRNVDPKQIVPFLSKEHPQTIALTLSQLEASQAAGVLSRLPREMQSDVAYRIARMGTISPQVMRSLEDSLAEDLQALLSNQITEIGGPKAVAEILNRTGRATEKAVLEDLDKQDANLAEGVRNQMFVYDDIANLTDREIQLLLKELDPRDLAIGLKGGCEELQERIFANMSEEVGAKVREEMKYSGPVRMSDVEAVQLRTVQLVRQLEEAGQVTIVRGDSQDVFV